MHNSDECMLEIKITNGFKFEKIDSLIESKGECLAVMKGSLNKQLQNWKFIFLKVISVLHCLTSWKRRRRFLKLKRIYWWGGGRPYMSHIGVCGPKGYGF